MMIEMLDDRFGSCDKALEIAAHIANALKNDQPLHGMRVYPSLFDGVLPSVEFGPTHESAYSAATDIATRLAWHTGKTAGAETIGDSEVVKRLAVQYCEGIVELTTDIDWVDEARSEVSGMLSAYREANG